MSQPSNAEIELAFYEKFFIERGIEPYPIQEEAFGHIFAGRNLLVTVPTGTGKTVIAKAALHRALSLGKRAIYTTPLRALTEEKFRELCADFGEENVGFATGDYKVNTDAPLQVMVAEILWNKIFGDRVKQPADVVVMDEGHYFNDPERGHIWEQSIIGLDPRSQLIILSATVGAPEQFCMWVYMTRRVQMELVKSEERRVPLYHEYQERYLIEVVKELSQQGGYPAIIFNFGRELCFERARLLRSCPRFTTDEERAQIAALAAPVLLGRGLSEELKGFLLHGIGIHHAGILPKYKQLVEQLTLQRLLKFVLSTETISAGINLPAKRVVFPALRKFIQGKPRLLSSAEYHQMAGRAGRPQFDTEGIAITLAPEEVVQEARKELKDAQKAARFAKDEAQIWRTAYTKARTEAQKKNDILWERESFQALVKGMPAPLSSRTKVSPEQILAIGLPDLSQDGDLTAPLPDLPASQDLHIKSVIANLLLGERERQAALKQLEMITRNLQAMGVLDERGQQVKGEIINKLRGIDGPFVYYALVSKPMEYEQTRAMVEYLLDHDAIWKIFTRKEDDKKREWIRNRLRERRQEQPQTTWDDVVEEYERTFPRELTEIEKLHAEFMASLPHPELHGGKKFKDIWAKMEDSGKSFMDFVEEHGLTYEEGNLFSYLARVMKIARQLHEVSQIDEFKTLENNVRRVLSIIDERVIDEWS